jgi:hypothetical protein
MVVAACIHVVHFADVQLSQPKPCELSEQKRKPSDSTQPPSTASAVSVCGANAWDEVINTCSADLDRFEQFLGGSFQPMLRTVQQISHLNLVGFGGPHLWGSGICTSNSTAHNDSASIVSSSNTPWDSKGDTSSTSVSDCARSLRVYLDSCPPLLGLSATNSSSASHGGLITRRLLSASDGKKSCVGTRCFGMLDLLFARQCLREAFPGILNVTRTLTILGEDDTTPFDDYAFYHTALDTKVQWWDHCTLATKVLFHECSECSNAVCGSVIERIAAQRAVTCDLNQSAEIDTSAHDKRSGCACHCYAQGTKCEAAMLDALRTSAQVSGGCRALQQRIPSSVRQASSIDKMMPSASTLTMMLYGARGARDIPIVNSVVS